MRLLSFAMVVFLCLSMAACSKNPIVQTDENTPSMPPATSDIEGRDKDAVTSDDIEATNKKAKVMVEADLNSYFEGLTGTAVFLNPSGTYTINNSDESELQVSPCSTFKIISTLAAFESGVISPEQSNITWDGTEWSFESWNKDLTISEAFRSSCVWYYRKIIDEIGLEYMQNFLDSVQYGNCDISQWEGSSYNGIPLIDGFWLESSLLVSPREQVDIMRRIFEGKTDINTNYIAELKKMMYKEGTDNIVEIYGKTGSGNGGWYVGFFVSAGENTYFAVRLSQQEGANGQKAQQIAENIIHEYFVETTGS